MPTKLWTIGIPKERGPGKWAVSQRKFDKVIKKTTFVW